MKLVAAPVIRPLKAIGLRTILLQSWGERATHICKQCGGFPRTNPENYNEWGCIVCDTIDKPHTFRERRIASASNVVERDPRQLELF